MKRSGTLSRVVGTRSGIPWCTQARSVVGPGDPGAPQPVATGHHWPRSTIFRVLVVGSPSRRRVRRELWEVLHPRCCGLDVHKETVVACVRLAIDGKVVKESRTFSTTTADLIAMSEWLAENKCTHVAMEATGVYWKPVWHILADGGFELVLANAAHIKNVPG